MRLRLVAVGLAAAMGSADAVDHRQVGDVLENALPASAAAIELWRGDREGLWQLGSSFTVTLLATQALKKGLNVRRPDGGVESFPSGHASKAFAAATYMHRRHGLDSAWPWYAAAGYVGWTRVNANRHRWGDVAGSAVLAGLSSWWLVTPAESAKVSLIPSVGAGRIHLELQARW